MKLTAFILLVTTLHVSAKSLGQNVTLTQREISVSSLLKEIHRQTGYKIFWSETRLQQLPAINVQFSNTPLKEALNKALEGLPFTYEIAGNNIIIVSRYAPTGFDSLYTALAPAVIHGRVLDSTGHPLSNVNVVNKQQKGPAAHTFTNASGEFTIMAEKGDHITFSYIGYMEQSLTVGAATELTITLQPDVNELDRFTINTGYQRIARERSAGSFSNPDIRQFALSNSGGTSLANRLDGLVPGLVVNNSPTLPGVTIRGITSLNAAVAPLYVVDGLPMENVNDLNYNDVGAITVLKDATATSIWGARAANGVIVITTKKANSNRLQVDYDVSYNLQGKPDFDYQQVMNSGQYIQTMKEVYSGNFFQLNTPLDNYPGLYAVPPHYQILYNRYLGKISASQANASLDSLAQFNNTDQISSLFYRKQVLGNHTLSVSGGGGIHSFRASFSYTDNVDNTPKNSSHAYTLLLRNDFNFGTRVKAFVISQLRDNEADGARYGAVRPAINFPIVPYAMYQANGRDQNFSWLRFSDSIAQNYQALSGISTAYLPLSEANAGYTDSSSLNAMVKAGATIRLLDGLRFEGVYGLERNSGESTSFDDAGSWTVRALQLAATSRPTTAGGKPTYYLPMTGGVYKNYTSRRINWTVRNQLVFDKVIHRKHQVTVLVGQEAQKNLYKSATTTEYGYDPQLLTYTPINYAALSTTVVTNPVQTVNAGIKINARNYIPAEVDYRFRSYYANGAYTFDRKYTINGSWRNDQSNLFGEDRSAQRKPVWSVGAAWALSNEHFMAHLPWLNRLSMRGTYGITGNAPMPGTAASFDILSATTSAVFTSGGLTVSTPANKTLTWEETKTVNLGIDFSVLNNRLSGSIDLYRKKTTNLIGLLPLNAFTGYATITGNYGDMENKGIELGLTSLNVQQQKFSWSTTLNLGYNRNKITRVQSSTPYTLGSQMVNTRTTYVTGYPAQTVFAYNYAGLDTAGVPQIRLADGKISNKKNAATPADMLNMGTYQPVWSGGLINVMTYGSFTLSAKIIFEGGNVMRRDVPTAFSGNLINNVSQAFADRWKQKGDELRTEIPAFQANATTAATYDFTYYMMANTNVVSATFAKLRDLSLSYDLPVSAFAKAGVKGITLRAGISNVMLWKANHFGIDPEFQQSRDAGLGANSINYAVRNIPTGQHMINLGAHVTF